MTAPLTDGQLYELAARADARNHRLGISGILLVRDDCFFQVLEGHPGFVGDLFADIATDTRHTLVTKVLDAPIAEPAFREWSMRLITPDDISPEERSIVCHALDAVERHGGSDPREVDRLSLAACPGAIARGVYRQPGGGSARASPG